MVQHLRSAGRVVKLCVANLTEAAPLQVDFFNAAGESHDAFRLAAMHQPQEVSDLMQRLALTASPQ